MISQLMYGAALIAMIWVVVSNFHQDKISQLPFVMASSFLAAVMPQLYGLLSDDNPIALYYRRENVAALLCFTTLSCFLAGLWGYRVALRRGSTAEAPEPQRSKEAIYRASLWIGSGLVVVSLVSTILLSRLGGGVEDFFGEGGAYKIAWTGLPVYLILFVRLVYPGLFFLLMANSIRSTLFSKAMLGLAVLYPLAQIVLVNRRSDIVFFFLAGLIAVNAFYRIRLPRIALIGAVVATVGLILLQPEFRARNVHATYENSERHDVSLTEVLKESTSFAVNKEIAAAAYAVDYTWRQSAYQYGAIFWDAQVNQWVPASIFGQDHKNQLRIFQKLRDVTDNYAVWDRGRFYYIAQFGISDAFQQFGPLAAIVFFAIGYVFGRWYARRDQSVSYDYLLAVYMPYLALTVGHGITPMISRWPIDLAVLMAFSFLLRRFARKDKAAPRLVPGYAA